MSENNGGSPTLYTTDDTGNYVEYTPPEPPSFHETLPEDVRENEHLKDVKDGAELARYYVDLKSNYLKPPDTAEGYEFEKPDGFDLDSDSYSKFRNIAFENGMNQKQFEAMMNFEIARTSATKEAMQNNIKSAQEKAIEDLKTEWGDNYEKNLEAAKNVLRHEKIASPDFNKFLEESRLGDNPHVIRLFAKLSKLISEDAFNKPGSGSGGNDNPVDEAGRPMLRFPSMEG